VELYGLHTPLIMPGGNLVEILLESLKRRRLKLRENDILAIATKIVSTTEGRILSFDRVKPSRRAKILARKYGLEPGCVELVIRESRKIYGGVPRALLTLKNNILIANAGIDHSNIPRGNLILWPKNPQRSAEGIRRQIFEATGKRVGVAIVDSRTTPLRMGTVGIALGVAGFRPVKDYRKKKDLFGNTMLITRQAVADDLVGAAHLVMGETDERIPMVLVRGAPVEFTDDNDPRSIVIGPKQCMFMKSLKPRNPIK
jgi:coenzyme F420-0:L-glutamate ligase/coenzyme F420-1:gamma-L-glutamate ligase